MELTLRFGRHTLLRNTLATCSYTFLENATCDSTNQPTVGYLANLRQNMNRITSVACAFECSPLVTTWPSYFFLVSSVLSFLSSSSPRNHANLPLKQRPYFSKTASCHRNRACHLSCAFCFAFALNHLDQW